jgi:hypothetical protein
MLERNSIILNLGLFCGSTTVLKEALELFVSTCFSSAGTDNNDFYSVEDKP